MTTLLRNTFILMALLSLTACSSLPRSSEDETRDPLEGIVNWMKHLQDTSSDHGNLVADIEGGASAQTFNNMLAAMAFMLVDERERAERILDFYLDSMDRDNRDPRLQNFYLDGEARGFFQNMAIRDLDEADYRQAIWNGDRWMGDMGWMLFACKHYENLYGDSRYDPLVQAIRELFMDWYVTDGEQGYVGHGWRNFDERLHEDHGHHEGNIDAYAAFTMTGDKTYADGIAAWLLPQIAGDSRPLDLFAWKVLAFAPRFADDLVLLEKTPGYRKTVKFKGRELIGFSSFRNEDDNVWGDGLGHVACAHYAVGRAIEGDFYVKQMERMMIPSKRNGVTMNEIPYTSHNTPGYEWVETSKGFISCAAWYVMARKQFNPMQIASDAAPSR